MEVHEKVPEIDEKDRQGNRCQRSLGQQQGAEGKLARTRVDQETHQPRLQRTDPRLGRHDAKGQTDGQITKNGWSCSPHPIPKSFFCHKLPFSRFKIFLHYIIKKRLLFRKLESHPIYVLNNPPTITLFANGFYS